MTEKNDDATPFDSWDAFWEALKEAEPAEKLELARRQIEELTTVEQSWAVELVNALAGAVAGTPLVEELVELVESLRENFPQVARTADPWLRARQLDLAVQAGREVEESEIREVIGAMLEAPDTVSRANTRMLYHGLGDRMVGPMLETWPDIEQADSIMPWGIRRYAWRAMTLVILSELEERPDIATDDKQLWERLEPLTVPEQRPTNEVLISHFAGRPDNPVQPEHLDGLAIGELRDTAMMLVAEFADYLLQERGWTAGRTTLGFTVLDEYLRRVVTDRQSRSPRYAQRDERYADREKTPDEALEAELEAISPVVIQPAEFVSYMEQEYNDLLVSHYQGTLLVELVEPWHSFLVERGYLEEELAGRLMQAIHGRVRRLPERLAHTSSDALLRQNLQKAIARLDR